MAARIESMSLAMSLVVMNGSSQLYFFLQSAA